MPYSDMFDGDEHWLDEGCEPGWRKPWLRVVDWVERDPQPKRDKLESAEINLVITDDAKLEAVWGIERGWSAFAVMIQNVGELVSPDGQNLLEVEQHVVRDPKTWVVKSTHYRVFWKGDEVEGI